MVSRSETRPAVQKLASAKLALAPSKAKPLKLAYGGYPISASLGPSLSGNSPKYLANSVTTRRYLRVVIAVVATLEFFQHHFA